MIPPHSCQTQFIGVKNLVFRTLLMLLAPAIFGQSATIYVDFGPAQGQTTSPDANGRYWNNVTEQNRSGLTRLRTDAGQETPISLGLSGTFGFNPGGTTTPNPATLLGLAVQSATQDWAFVQGNDVMTLKLGNLAPNGVYRLSLFGSRNSSETRSTRYDIIGLTTTTKRLVTSGIGIGQAPEADANRSDLVVVDNLVPSADGELIVTVRRDQNASGAYIGLFAYLNALRLEAITGVNYSPAASGVVAAGAPKQGAALRGNYIYSDFEQDPESGTEFFWERANSTTSATTRVSDALTYNLTESEIGCYVRFAVTPKASSGYQQGKTAYSNWLGPVASSAAVSTFHIGSSFTLWPNIPLQLKNLAASSGQELITGQQLTAGSNSKFHWENGLAGGAFATGTPSRLELAAGSWEVVVLQPFNSEWFPNSVAQMRDYIQRYYSLADSNGSQVYLYNYWPWLSYPLASQNEINSVFESVRSSISVSGNKPALIIPSGPALKAVIDACGSGALVGYSRSSFYRDDLHTNDLGSYVSALTHYATILKKSPVGLPAQALDSSQQSDSVVNLPPAVATRIQQIVWNVVSTYPNTGVVVPIVPPPPPPPPPVYVTHTTVTDPQLVAFAFGPSTDGVTAPSGNLPHAVLATEPGQVALEYTINPDAETAQVTFTPEWSTDLVNWTATKPAGFTETRVGQKVVLAWDQAASGSQFVRIYVVKP